MIGVCSGTHISNQVVSGLLPALAHWCDARLHASSEKHPYLRKRFKPHGRRVFPRIHYAPIGILSWGLRLVSLAWVQDHAGIAALGDGQEGRHGHIQSHLDSPFVRAESSKTPNLQV
jgi:hypothetical protein